MAHLLQELLGPAGIRGNASRPPPALQACLTCGVILACENVSTKLQDFTGSGSCPCGPGLRAAAHASHAMPAQSWLQKSQSEPSPRMTASPSSDVPLCSSACSCGSCLKLGLQWCRRMRRCRGTSAGFGAASAEPSGSQFTAGTVSWPSSRAWALSCRS